MTNHSKLQGLRVLNTRPLEQSGLLAAQITQAGGKSIAFPCISIDSVANRWVNQLPSFSQINQAIFTSSNAVNYFFKGLYANDLIWPRAIPITAIGSATADTLKGLDIPVHFVPKNADSESLLNLPNFEQVQDQRILLIKGVGGRRKITATLRTRGAVIELVNVYRRAAPVVNKPFTEQLWREDLVDIILLTSQQAMHQLFKCFDSAQQAWLKDKPVLVISQRLAQSARVLGMKKIMVCRYNAILTALEHYQQGRTDDAR